jgi:hypothetical protein
MLDRKCRGWNFGEADLQTHGTTSFGGLKFTSQSKRQLMEGLAVALQQQRIRYPDGPIVRELETFGYEYTRIGVWYCAPEGLHDDCVCALALAVMALERRWVRPVAPIVLERPSPFRVVL